jgi:hypothetical protein
MSYIGPEEVLSSRKRVGGIFEVIHDPGETEGASPGSFGTKNPLWRFAGAATRTSPWEIPCRGGSQPGLLYGEYAAASVEQAAREAAERSPNSLVAKYREIANDSEGEREAEEWSEGLIGDASAQG